MRKVRTGDLSAGPRAALRVTDVLLALADHRDGATLDALSALVDVPRASLYRLLRELESARYVVSERGGYRLGPTSLQLASRMMAHDQDAPLEIQARPHLRRLAAATRETAMLGLYDPVEQDVFYAEVIDSLSPVRFTVPVGDRRPLHSAAAGKAVFCFLSAAQRAAYFETATFPRYTPHTPQRDEIIANVRGTRKSGIAHDWDGSFVGASAIASPVFLADARVIGSVSVAGPTERVRMQQARIEELVRGAGQDLSALMGYIGSYPPAE